MAHHAFCGISRHHLCKLIEELAPYWEARCKSGRHGVMVPGNARHEPARSTKWSSPSGLVTLVHLRTGLTHAALGVIYEVGSSTIGRATARSDRCRPRAGLPCRTGLASGCARWRTCSPMPTLRA
ncbi:transposase family protein [Streptomyces sp. NPDC017405]|uniref:transposase family protein n=2 Tax=Streptomyces TaxID=1883 RepID=UPI0037AA5F99